MVNVDIPELLSYVPPVTKKSVGKLTYVVADIVLAVNPSMKFVAPVTVPPVKLVAVDVEKPVTLNVPPVLFINVAIPSEYVPPVTFISKGNPRYVVADKLPFMVKPLKLFIKTFTSA